MTIENLIKKGKEEGLIAETKIDKNFIHIYNSWTNTAYIISITDKNAVKSLENYLKLLNNFKNKLISEDSDFLRSTQEYQDLIELGYEDITTDKQEKANKIALTFNNYTYIIFVKKNDEDSTAIEKYITTIEKKYSSNNSSFIFKLKTINIIKGIKEALNKLKDLKNV